MPHPIIRRILVLLLAILVTAGMGLSAVQASDMKMMDMHAGMAMTGSVKCQDCGTSGDSKGMAPCMASACATQAAAPQPWAVAFDQVFVPVHHGFQNRVLFGRDTVPDPYPPRTIDIG